MDLNGTTTNLPAYPMEELARIRTSLQEAGQAVYDFGTGDPNIPIAAPIREAIANAIPEVCRYPSVQGTPALREAHQDYLQRRFQLDTDELGILPTFGSKEAVFHLALSVVGRAGGRKHIIYPDPGYPVYRSSTQFAGGIPYPVKLEEETGYRLEPWNLPKYIQQDAAAIWVNYPHNPTGATVDRNYWEQLLAWAQSTNTMVLSDDCYIDIYDVEIEDDDPRRPLNPLQIDTKGVLSLMSLSKRSGMTGFRSGMIAGDPEIVKPLARARANFGVGVPSFIEAGATVAWLDDDHVLERRKIFSERMHKAGALLQSLDMMREIPDATFYLWARVPQDRFKGNDVKFAKELAKLGVVASPSSFLGETSKGYVRFALVPGGEELDTALEIVSRFVKGEKAVATSTTDDDEDFDESGSDEEE